MKDERFQLFLDLLRHLDNFDLKQVAKDADVHPSTLRKWVFGDTMNPRLNTILKVAEATGLQVVLKRASRKRLKAVA